MTHINNCFQVWSTVFLSVGVTWLIMKLLINLFLLACCACQTQRFVALMLDFSGKGFGD